MDDVTEWLIWYESRPEYVRRAINKWPPMTTVIVEGKIAYLLGYTETEESERTQNIYDLMLMLSYDNPCDDYDQASQTMFRICAQHVRPLNESQTER